MAVLMKMSDVRVVDPILTTVVQGYVQPDFVGDFLFPRVPVGARSGYIIEFGKEDFALYDTRRAPGGPTKRRTTRYSSRRFNLKQDALEGELPREYLEEAQAVNLPIDLQREAAESAMNSVLLNLEYDQAAIATNAANYDSNHKVTLSGTDQWTNSASDPLALVVEWKEAIRRSIGRYPNTAVMGANVYNAAITNATLRDQVKYTSQKSLNTTALAEIFDLSRGVKPATALALDESTDTLEDIWGDVMILAYVPETITSNRNPSYGYTYTLRNYPMAERPYYDDNHRTWYFPVTAERSPEMTSMQAGFLAQGIV